MRQAMLGALAYALISSGLGLATAALRRQNHATFEEVSGELVNLDNGKEEQITFSTRAPTSTDKGRFWVKYTAASDTTIDFYIRHPNSGTWRKASAS